MESEPKLDLPEPSSDLPPESFYVPSDDEFEWFDRNAVMQRKTSLKLGFNHHFNSFSHRSNTNLSTPSVFALPKVQKTGRPEGNPPQKKSLFRSRSEPGGKPPAHVSEPGSPRVSCTGRVGFKSADSKKTGFSRIVSSLFGARTGRSRSQKRGNKAVRGADRPV